MKHCNSQQEYFIFILRMYYVAIVHHIEYQMILKEDNSYREDKNVPLIFFPSNRLHFTYEECT